MSAISEWRNLRNYLSVSHKVVKKKGTKINEGEEFTLRIKVLNTASYPSCYAGRPNIVFRNVSVSVRSTQYARPSAGNFVVVNLNDQTLTANDSGYVDVKMRAIDEISGFFEDLFNQEFIAHVEVRADLDQNAYFRICKHTHLNEEIDPRLSIFPVNSLEAQMS